MFNSKPVRYNKKTFAQIKDAWNALQFLEIKKRMKIMRTIAADIEASYDPQTATSEELVFYLKILNEVAQVRSFPQPVSRLRSKLLVDWFILVDNDKAKIISKIKLKISGGLCGLDIGDPSFFTEYQSDILNDKLILDFVNQGKVFRIDTTNDGLRSVELRITNGSEPILTYKEMQSVQDSSAIVILQIPTGNIIVASTGELKEGNNKDYLKTTILPGNYKAAVYHRGNTLYVVLCSTNQEAKNNLQTVYCFNEY